MKTLGVQNIAAGNRQVTIHGNSGKTWHLPPMFTATIPEIEIISNKMVEKLVKKKCLLIHEKNEKTKKSKVTTKKATTKKVTTKRNRPAKKIS